MIDRVLQRHLEPVARDQRRWELLRTLTRGWLVAAGVGALLLLLHHLGGLRSPWLPLLLFVATCGWTLFVWQRSRRAKTDYQALARQIEQENPELHALLLTAIEQQPDQATHQLNYLQERVIREALMQDRGRDWHGRTMQRLDVAGLASVATLVLLFGVFAALYHTAPPSVAFMALTGRTVTVTPGDTSVEKGSSLVVLAKFAGDVPVEASLVVRPANAPEQRISLNKNLDDPVFGTSLPEVQDALTYRVEYGGETTREFRVAVFEFPRLERADVNVTFPEYTGLPAKTIEDTRRVSAVEGSALDYTFHLNKLVKSAALVAKDSSHPSINLSVLPRVPPAGLASEGENGSAGGTHGSTFQNAAPNHSTIYTSSFKLEKSGRYELLLVDDAGCTNRLPPLFVLEALTNRVPELKFAFPRGDQRVSALEEIAFKAETSDDFGLKGYGIAYNLAGHAPKFIELGQPAGPHEKRSFDHLVPLESLGAQPDQLLSYYVWADDIGPDGLPRRTASDMFFADVRPFDEIFREGQPQDPNQQQQQQQQGQQGQNDAGRLAELQKQIITATWNLQRRETGKTPTPGFKQDADTVKESQENALEQVSSRIEQQEDPSAKVLLETVQKEMTKAVEQLKVAAGESSPKALPSALSAEQSAYQALLRLAAREYQVAQGQRGQPGQSSRGARAQRQLDQLDLRQSQNRYETERQAAPPQSPEQREQLQAFNRLKELAQRQQDVNERLKELQAALREAKTEAEREELHARLKRLKEEQQQMLADVDELRQRMERPENQSQMSEARQQLDQTRDEVQRASEAMQRGEVPQALASGTRAQRDLQQLRDDFRKQSSSQFADDMREMRSQARELSQNQEEIGQKLDALNDSSQRQSLTDSEERKELASQLDGQKKRMDELIKHATDVTQKAEEVEPLLSRQLYDTLRKATQDDARNLQETTDDLLGQGRLYRSVYDELRQGKAESKKAVEVAANLLRNGFSAEADNLEGRARQSINELKTGVERAAESVLGDDLEALRLARNELDELSRQLERELSQAQRSANTNRTASGQTASASRGEQRPGDNQGEQTGRQSDEQEQANARDGQQGQGQQQAGDQSQQGPGQQGDQQGRQAQSGQRGQGEQGNEAQQAGQAQARGSSASSDQSDLSDRSDSNRPTGSPRTRDNPRNFLDQLGGQDGGGMWGGPITGPEYTQWSDRLRDVEEMLDVPELRAEAARIRDRARNARQDLKRHSKEPQWDLVRMEIAGPLVELRTRVSEELARRESKEAIAPIDRDPVPARYAERVRRYYEELGKSE